MMNKLQKEIGLRVLNGDINNLDDGGARAKYYYKGRPIRIINEVYLKFGVEIDGDGYAKAYARNDKKRNVGETEIVYLDGRGGRESVFKKDIEFKFNIETQFS